ncbi:hypothetical protein ACFPK9_03380 [Rubritalea spongiae]|uniref:Uncharacterized protein n=1 Tax=Rubritalea spongiae TaxID=430797 RepID=A0ABW5E6U1_9BACT
MKTQIKSVADELREDLESCPDLRAQQLIDLDEAISELNVKFEQKLDPNQMEDWAVLREKIDELRRFAQLTKMRLLYGDEDLRSKLDTMHPTEQGDEAKAALEVERDAHRVKGVSDIFKALLMWKDAPEERIKKDS